MLKRQPLLACLLLTATSTQAGDLPSPAAIDQEAQRLMQREDVKGLALATIDGGEIVHVAAYGYRNVENRLPLTTDTVMYGASFTKTAFAYLVLQLVDGGRIDLDQPLYQRLPYPLPDYQDYEDLAGDDRWRLLTARHVLTHSTGFANFRWLEDDKKLRFHFAPGARYAYSGEGFYLLQFVLESGLKLSVGDEMQQRLFEPLGMQRTSLQWRADFADNLADGYGIDGGFEPHDDRSTVSAAGSMDTTIADQARLWAAIVRGDGLSTDSRAELVEPQLPIRSAHQFPTLYDWSDPRAAEMGLAAGLGLVVAGRGDARTWFKGGHNPWTGNMAVCREVLKRCLVMLSNSVRAELIYPELVDFVLPDAGVPWWWEYHRDD